MGRLSPADFHTVYGFRRPNVTSPWGLTPGLRSGLSLHPPPEAPELRCCPSSLYTFPAGVSPGLARDCHFKVSPNLSSSASPVSQTSTQVFLKSAAYAIPPRPRAAVLLMIGHAARFYTSFSSSPVCACAGISTLSSSTLFLFVRMTLIAAARVVPLAPLPLLLIVASRPWRVSDGMPRPLVKALPQKKLRTAQRKCIHFVFPLRSVTGAIPL